MAQSKQDGPSHKAQGPAASAAEAGAGTAAALRRRRDTAQQAHCRSYSSHRKPHAAPMQRPRMSASTIRLPACSLWLAATPAGPSIMAQAVR